MSEFRELALERIKELEGEVGDLSARLKDAEIQVERLTAEKEKYRILLVQAACDRSED